MNKFILSLKGFWAVLIILSLVGCNGGSDSPGTRIYYSKSANNVIYKNGDVMIYDAVGEYIHADGSKTVITGGRLSLDVIDEGLTNPLNNNIKVMTLVEAQYYNAQMIDPAGKVTPATVVSTVYRYYIQDPLTGTINYQGDGLPEGVDDSGNTIYNRYWFDTPKDYVQYQMPLNINDTRQVTYLKKTVDGALTHQGVLNTAVSAKENVSVPIGTFEASKMSFIDVNQDPGMEGSLISDRVQYIYPDIGIVKFEFNPTAPGDTGTFNLSLSYTNIPI